jgi:signal transduction histidine kinase
LWSLYSWVFLSFRLGPSSRIFIQAQRWNFELAEALMNDNWTLAARYAGALQSPYLSGVELRRGERTLHSLPSEFEAAACNIRWTHSIRHYQIKLGELSACPSVAAIMMRTLFSPSLIVLTFGTLILLSLSTIIPLKKYKTSTLNIIAALERQAESSNPNDVVLNQNENHDEIAMQVAQLINRMIRERLARQRAELETDAMKQFGLLAARVAHDIQSPLSALNIAVQLDPKDESARNLIKKAGSRIREIAEDLLIQSKKKLAAPKPQSDDLVKTHDVVSLVPDVVNPIVAEKELELSNEPSVELTVEVPERKELVVASCASDLRRALSNLINNSLEAIGDGGRIAIRLKESNGHAVLSVSDNGRGIAPDDLRRVWDLGYTTSKRAAGSGMGLYFTRKTVEACGGRLALQSEVNTGTTIELYLPILDKNSKLGLVRESEG